MVRRMFRMSQPPRLSLILMVWNTAHLLERTLCTLETQDTAFNWELIVVDDNSLDDVPAVLNKHTSLPIRYFRLEHDMGMRGNTVSSNYGVCKARSSEVVMWSTPEVMFSPGTLQAAWETARVDEPRWVTVPSHGISHDIQVGIDETDWRNNISCLDTLANLAPVDHWDSAWFYLNFYDNGRRDTPSKRERGIEYGNNQSVAVNKSIWNKKIGRFPYFLDWGSDDPWIAGKRRKEGYRDITLWDYPGYHQWHINCQYWMAQGLAPHWNKFAHTIDNVLGDPEVPPGGTCELWDGGNREKMTKEEIESTKGGKYWVEATGYRSK